MRHFLYFFAAVTLPKGGFFMRKILVTGGTAFVSRYTAEYFRDLGDEVYVLNRGSKPQSKGVTHIKADRRNLGDVLKKSSFDAVLDVTAYTKEDVLSLLEGLGDFGEYILVSSSAVYPETSQMPCKEEAKLGRNKFWGDYGTNKIEAETALKEKVPKAYILRPPYLYGAMENVYREPFVFDSAEAQRVFVLPYEKLSLQFFHVRDLCRFMDILLSRKPEDRIYNVGNTESVSAEKWVNLCYEAAGKQAVCKRAPEGHFIRSYFPFVDYNYSLDVSKMSALMSDTIPLSEGLIDSYMWYKDHRDEMVRKPYFEYIDSKIFG